MAHRQILIFFASILQDGGLAVHNRPVENDCVFDIRADRKFLFAQFNSIINEVFS